MKPHATDFLSLETSIKQLGLGLIGFKSRPSCWRGGSHSPGFQGHAPTNISHRKWSSSPVRKGFLVVEGIMPSTSIFVSQKAFECNPDMSSKAKSSLSTAVDQNYLDSKYGQVVHLSLKLHPLAINLGHQNNISHWWTKSKRRPMSLDMLETLSTVGGDDQRI